MGYYAVDRTDDPERDARHNERLAWHRVVRAMDILIACTAARRSLARRRWRTARAAYARAWRQLNGVSP